METSYLLPNKFKKLGWVLFTLGLLGGIFDELVSVFIIVGGFLVGFTKEKIEDEFIYKLRKDSLVWALIVNYSILLVAILFVYDMTFLHILFFNMFTTLVFFVIRFTVLKSKYLSHEE